MAENTSNESKLIQDVKTLLWGPTVKEDVFERWAQGFYFSPDEPTALVQMEGGPCAVLAPVQAFIIKQLLQENISMKWSTVTENKSDEILIKAMTEIIAQAVSSEDLKYSIAHIENNISSSKRVQLPSTSQEDRVMLSDAEVNAVETVSVNTSLENTPVLPSDLFHSNLRIEMVRSIEEVEKYLMEKLTMLKDSFGVLLLLYTVVFTKGVDNMKSEMSDPTEQIIDSTYGYGSQSLINLMLTGRAVSHVWDYDQDVGGLRLRGIEKQNTVGFLALLEHLRYLKVGSFLKSPSYPVWVLGSETHLTVLFSTEKRLVSPETPTDKAKRVFRKYDPDDTHFVSTNYLQNILADLDLVADTEYVDIVKKKLDSEDLGIILLREFLEEFFPNEQRTCPDTFVLYHYNGLLRSNPDNKVQYHHGQAVLLECNFKCILDSNPMLTVLQTKWPNIEIQWDLGRTPSLN